GPTCRLRDLNSRFGTTLNGTMVTEATVRDGDRIIAGQTTIVVRVEDDKPRPVPTPGEAPLVARAAPVSEPPVAPRPRPDPELPDRLLSFFSGAPEPLFALLDAARDPQILGLLQESREEYRSLYEGFRGELLAAYAPYLVRLSARSRFLEKLVRQGWGRSW